jgi:hypothetical protein
VKSTPFAGARAAGLAVALTAMAVLAGCSSSGAGSGSGSAAGSSPPALSPSVPGPTLLSPIPGTPSQTGSTSRTPTSAPPATPRPTPKPTPAGPATCTTSQLKLGVLEGSGAAGQEFAQLTFTNNSAVSCAMFGFPGVSLRLHGALVGKPAQRSRTAPRSVLLTPGAQGKVTVTDFSSCQAPVSDTVRVYPPDQTAFVDLPLALRACRVVVDPVTHS